MFLNIKAVLPYIASCMISSSAMANVTCWFIEGGEIRAEIKPVFDEDGFSMNNLGKVDGKDISIQFNLPDEPEEKAGMSIYAFDADGNGLMQILATGTWSLDDSDHSIAYSLPTEFRNLEANTRQLLCRGS